MPGTVASPMLWVGFLGLVTVLLACDLGYFYRRPREVAPREAAVMTMLWVGLASLFALAVGWEFGADKAAQFLSGYAVEESLSVDNLFVFSVLLAFFAVPKQLQHGLLFWGICGALVLRGVFIGVGAALLHNIHFMVHVFGGVLAYTAVRLLFQKEESIDPDKNPVVRAARWGLPMVDSWRGEHFFVREGGRWLATPLFLVLLAVEFTDIVFAIDSIPAVFAVTGDPFIVYTSNIFAIMGLRSLYFLVAILLDKFYYLKVGVSVLLGVIGAKMLAADYIEVTGTTSLILVTGILGSSIVASIARARTLARVPVASK